MIGWIGVISGAAASVWGIAKAVGALRAWIAKKWEKHKERREMLPNLVRLNENMARRMDEMEQQIRNLGNDIGTLRHGL